MTIDVPTGLISSGNLYTFCISAFGSIKLAGCESQSHSFLLFAFRQERVNRELSNVMQTNPDPGKKKDLESIECI